MSQMTSTSFHENTMAKEPMDAMPIAGRSQQKSHTSPAVHKKSRAASAKNRKINIFFISFFFCNYILTDFRNSVNRQLAQNSRRFFGILYNKTELGAFPLKTRRPRFYPRAVVFYSPVFLLSKQSCISSLMARSSLYSFSISCKDFQYIPLSS